VPCVKFVKFTVFEPTIKLFNVKEGTEGEIDGVNVNVATVGCPVMDEEFQVTLLVEEGILILNDALFEPLFKRAKVRFGGTIEDVFKYVE